MDYEGKLDHISLLHQAIQRMDEKAERTAEAIFGEIKSTRDKVDKLTEVVSQQAVLFERLTTIETNHKDSTKRMYREFERVQNENQKRFEAIESHAKVLDDYMTHDGCPAHKSLQRLQNAQVEKFENRAVSIEKAVGSIDERVTTMEKAPTVALGKVGNAILVVLGTGIGAWLLYKLGIEVEK